MIAVREGAATRACVVPASEAAFASRYQGAYANPLIEPESWVRSPEF